MIRVSASTARTWGLPTKGIGLSEQCQYANLPKPEREYRFDESIGRRRWRFDYAWIDRRVAMEVDGGAWTGGRHTRGTGYRNDIEKLAEAMCQGWIVLRVMPEHVDDGRALMWLERIFKWRTDLQPHVSQEDRQ